MPHLELIFLHSASADGFPKHPPNLPIVRRMHKAFPCQNPLARILPRPPMRSKMRYSALAICGGDAIAALRITLIANAFLEAEIDRLSAAVSSGFARGKVRKAQALKEGKEKNTD